MIGSLWVIIGSLGYWVIGSVTKIGRVGRGGVVLIHTE